MTDTTHPSDFGLGDDTLGKRLLTQCRKVDEEFLPTLVALAHENIPRLQRGVVYKAQHIFGAEFWSDLDSNPLRRLVGQVLAHFVAKGKVELRFASCRYCTTKRYMRC